MSNLDPYTAVDKLLTDYTCATDPRFSDAVIITEVDEQSPVTWLATETDVTRAFDVPLLHLVAFAYANKT